MAYRKHLLTAAGFMSLAFALLGIFLPIMPTVPFILLAAACFSRSSPRFHKWLLEHKYMGPIVRQYESGQGLPKLIKIRVILLTWTGMFLSMAIVREYWAVFLLSCIGAAITVYLLKLPTTELDQ